MKGKRHHVCATPKRALSSRALETHPALTQRRVNLLDFNTKTSYEIQPLYRRRGLVLREIPQKSQAFIYGSDYSLSYVSDTKWTDNAGRPVALCVLKEYWHIMWIPGWSWYEYVLAPNACDTESIYRYEPGKLEGEIARGEITTITSATVPMTFGRILWGFTLSLLLIPLALFGLFALRAKGKRSARRAQLTAHIPEKVRGPLAFCLQAAMSDGTADDTELNAIAAALKTVYSQRLSVDQLRELVANTDTTMDAPEIKTFLQTASGDEKHKALQLVVMVTAADGRLDENELKFAVHAGAKLGFTAADVTQVYNERAERERSGLNGWGGLDRPPHRAGDFVDALKLRKLPSGRVLAT